MAATEQDIIEMLFPGDYDVRPEERDPFAGHWCGPKKFAHGREELIAVYKKHQGGNGQDVEVFCTAMSARFYRLHVKPSTGSVDNARQAFGMSTGSGHQMGQLAARMAEAIADGMLSVGPG
jgi:hypothetical protein